MEIVKTCKQCNQIKSLSEFKTNKSYKDGVESVCKECRKLNRLEKTKNLETLVEKECRVCKITKPISMFGINNSIIGGYENRCKECRNIYAANQRDIHRENNNKKYTDRYHSDPIFKEHRKQIQKQVTLKRKYEHPEKNLLFSAKQRAEHKNLEFNLELKDIIIPEYCPILNIKLSLDSNIQTSPSLDRIDINKGYIKGNVQVISMKANTMKNSATFEELKLFTKNILNYIKDEDIVRTIENVESIELENKESLG